jgi:SAM-dependent methyltransferase
MRNGQSGFKWLRQRLRRRSRLGTSFEDLREPAPLVADFFDSSWYVENNPDVARSGLDPWAHYLNVGAREGRRPGPKLDPPAPLRADAGSPIAVPAAKAHDRRAFLRMHIDNSTKVLEIGPAFNPIVSKSEGYRVYNVDNGDKSELRKRYDGFPDIDISKIEEVDFVWRDGDILSAIPPEHLGSFDVVLMGGVIEHIPNPIGLLQSLQKLLRPGGYVSLGVPDKRFCFDFLRPLTTTGAWLEAMQNGDVLHTQRTLFENKTMAVARRGNLLWVAKDVHVQDATFIGSALSDAYRDCFASKSDGQAQYIDAHAWVFTPSSFILIVNECHALGLISLVPECVSTRTDAEFLVHLRLAYRRPINHHERIQFLANCAREQAAGFYGVHPARKSPLRSLVGSCLKFFAR